MASMQSAQASDQQLFIFRMVGARPPRRPRAHHGRVGTARSSTNSIGAFLERAFSAPGTLSKQQRHSHLDLAQSRYRLSLVQFLHPPDGQLCLKAVQPEYFGRRRFSQLISKIALLDAWSLHRYEGPMWPTLSCIRSAASSTATNGGRWSIRFLEIGRPGAPGTIPLGVAAPL